MDYDPAVIDALKRRAGLAKLDTLAGEPSEREAAGYAADGIALVANLLAIGESPAEVLEALRGQLPGLSAAGAWETEYDELLDPKQGLETLENEV
jgi:hypothetical protein